VASGEVPLGELQTLPIDEAGAILRKIPGVGPKVASCALLYGFGRAECLPLDVWMNRVMKAWFPDGLPGEVLPVAGIAQQYLFHYVRMGKDLGVLPQGSPTF
jgi:N-glycosylase/DNA lyase